MFTRMGLEKTKELLLILMMNNLQVYLLSLCSLHVCSYVGFILKVVNARKVTRAVQEGEICVSGSAFSKSFWDL